MENVGFFTLNGELGRGPRARRLLITLHRTLHTAIVCGFSEHRKTLVQFLVVAAAAAAAAAGT